MVNHVGFTVDNVQQRVDQWKAAGVNVLPGNNNRLDQAFVVTPDGVRMEILEDKAQGVPIRHEHVHLSVPEAEIPKAQAWYAKTFGGTLAPATTTRWWICRAPRSVRQGRRETGADARAGPRPHRLRRQGSRRRREEDPGRRHQARRAGPQVAPATQSPTSPIPGARASRSSSGRHWDRRRSSPRPRT